MISNCCQEKMDVAGRTTKYYTCMKCNEPCDPWQCIRCNKLLDGTCHTCTPTNQFNAGVIEGLKMAFDVIDSCDERGFDSMYYIALNKVKYKLEKLIKQYSGDK